MARTMTDEEKKAWGEKMKAAREAKKEPTEKVLDLTVANKNFEREDEFVRWILWEFDNGTTPDTIKVNSHQALVIANFAGGRVPVTGYHSPFGSHKIEIVPAKDIPGETQA